MGLNWWVRYRVKGGWGRGPGEQACDHPRMCCGALSILASPTGRGCRPRWLDPDVSPLLPRGVFGAGAGTAAILGVLGSGGGGWVGCPRTLCSLPSTTRCARWLGPSAGPFSPSSDVGRSLHPDSRGWLSHPWQRGTSGGEEGCDGKIGRLSGYLGCGRTRCGGVTHERGWIYAREPPGAVG